MKINELFGPSGTHKTDFVQAVVHTEVKSRENVLDMLKDVEKLGGEGLMIRKPGS